MCRCFSCANEQCALAGRTAGSEVDVAACASPQCPGGGGGKMRLKRNQRGYLLACSQPACKALWWVPNFVRAGESSLLI